MILDHNGQNLYLFSYQNLRDYTLWGGTYTYMPYIGEFPFSLPSPGSWDGHKKMRNVGQWNSDKSMTLSISIVKAPVSSRYLVFADGVQEMIA